MVTLMLMLTSVLAFDGGLPCESTLWLGEVGVLFGSDAVVLMCTSGGGERLVVSSPEPQTKVCCSIAEDLRQLPVSDSPKAEGMLHAPETFMGKLTMGFGCCRAEGGNNDCLRGNSTRCSIDELPKRYSSTETSTRDLPPIGGFHEYTADQKTAARWNPKSCLVATGGKFRDDALGNLTMNMFQAGLGDRGGSLAVTSKVSLGRTMS